MLLSLQASPGHSSTASSITLAGRSTTTWSHLDEPPTSSASLVGRPSKVMNEELIKAVGGTLGKYVTDSSKVITVRKDGQKTLVCAKLMSKKMWGIWKLEPALRKKMSFSTFRKIKRAQFPHLRRPGRKTDVCSHCRVLKRKISPRATTE